MNFSNYINNVYNWKFICMILTNFDEFLFFDSDNNVVRDPSYLFDYMKI